MGGEWRLDIGTCDSARDWRAVASDDNIDAVEFVGVFHGAAEGVFSRCSSAVIQRLGYLVEEVLGDSVQGGVIYDEWRKMPVPRRTILLNADRRTENAPISERWKIVVNEIVEEDD